MQSILNLFEMYVYWSSAGIRCCAEPCSLHFLTLQAAELELSKHLSNNRDTNKSSPSESCDLMSAPLACPLKKIRLKKGSSDKMEVNE